MASRRPRTMAAPRTRASHAMAAARATAAAALTLAMVAMPTGKTDAFVSPPAAFPSPSVWLQRGTATTPASSLTPTATALVSGGPIAADASERECAGANLRSTEGRGGRRNRFRSALGLPLHSSSPGGDSGTPESGEGAGDEDTADADADADPAGDGMADSEKLRAKLETIAKTAAPIMDDVSSGGLTQAEQQALEELEEDKRVEEELERLEAEHLEKSMNAYVSSAKDGEGEQDPDAKKYEEIVANMTKPLGITIEESTDRARLVYITAVGEKAEAAGLQVGDVLTGASAVFGDAVWSVMEKSIEEIRSLVRCRTEPYSLIRVERGHVSLEERCKPGFDDDETSPCWNIPEGMLGDNAEECELNPNYAKLWSAVYEDELEVLKGKEWVQTMKGGRSGFSSSGAQPKKGNQGPPPKDKPGPGSFNGETFTGDSWDTSGNSF